MRCLAVTVNGERYCLAGAEHVAMINASVTYGAPDDVIDRDRAALQVHGLSGDVTADYYWGVEKLALTTGDVVTIRVVDETAADLPTPFPVSEFLAEIRQGYKAIAQESADRDRRMAALMAQHPKLRTLAELDPEALRQEMRGSLRSLLLWCGVVLIAGAVWFFWP